MLLIPAGLSLGTTSVSTLVAKIFGSPWARSASVSLVMFFWSAEANTSAGAPSVSCCTSPEDPP